MHKSRNNRKANQKRFVNKQQIPLTQTEQEKRRKQNKASKDYNYPHAPTYNQPKFGAKGKI